MTVDPNLRKRNLAVLGILVGIALLLYGVGFIRLQP